MSFSDLFFHFFGFGSTTYLHPVLVNGEVPITYLEMGFRSPAHKGRYYHAQDFAVPDPRTDPQQIMAPATGQIIYLNQNHDIWGNGREFAYYTNVMSVKVTAGRIKQGVEFYELAHFAKGSCPYKLGDTVVCGEPIATTGLNGWITKTDDVWDTHLHFMVGMFLKYKRGLTFNSLRIRYKRAITKK